MNCISEYNHRFFECANRIDLKGVSSVNVKS